ncbi:hypothetical protein Q2316_25305, partial [Escherichia coli]|nr:hypothetical protein [Escherichia coli]
VYKRQEFFDKAVFSSLVLTLRDEGYISDSGDAEPAETMKVYQLLAELITSDGRLTIGSATQGEGESVVNAGCDAKPLI